MTRRCNCPDPERMKTGFTGHQEGCSIEDEARQRNWDESGLVIRNETVSDLSEAREAAQQFFETCVANHSGTLLQKAVFVNEIIYRWPWLRPNPYIKHE